MVKVKMENKPESETENDETLVWQKSTWGTRGQHQNVYTFVIDVEKLTTTPIFQLVTVRHENEDSRKNIHRYTYAKISEIKEKLRGKIMKIVDDYASSSRRVINVKYCIIGDKITELEYETGLRDNNGFYDAVKLPDGRTLIVRKNSIEVKAE